MMDYQMATNGVSGHPAGMDEPFVIITEQPSARGFRFRYPSEGTSHGGIQGENSQRDKKTFPTVKICNYEGPFRIMVTLMTEDNETHAHELVGKNCTDGVCLVYGMGNEMEISFQNLGVQHWTKSQMIDSRRNRLVHLQHLDRLIRTNLLDSDTPVSPAYPEDNQSAKQWSTKKNVVCLQFQAYLLTKDNKFLRVLPPVLSQPIHDSKAPGSATLKIFRMDRSAGCCSGNDEVFLLCDKVQKADDIAIYFYEMEGEKIKWEATAVFGPADVHKQFAIVFNTPPYRNVLIEAPVKVMVQLRRKSNSETSDPLPFTYHPQQNDIDGVERKRRKQIFPVDGFANLDSIFDIHSNLTAPFAFAAGQSARSWQQPGIEDIRTSDCLMAERGVGGEPSAPQPLETDAEVVAAPPQGYVPLAPLSSRTYPDDCDVERRPTFAASEASDSRPTGHVAAAATSKPESPTVRSPSDEHAVAPSDVALRAQAMRNYARTGNAAYILFQDRHLLSVADRDGDTAVHLAIINRKTDALANIIDINPHRDILNQFNTLKQTPLHLATLTNQVDMVELLVGKSDCYLGDKHGNTCLHIAARLGNDQCLRKLLALGTFNRADILATTNFSGLSVLHEAVLGGHVSCVDLLLSVGADINKGDDRSGRTPLQHAAETNNLAIIEVLVNQPSLKVDQPTLDGHSALHLAVGRGLLAAAAMLVAVGADPTLADGGQTDDDGQTPLDIAADNDKMLRILHGDSFSVVMATDTSQCRK